MLEHGQLILGNYCVSLNCGFAEKPEHSLINRARLDRALSCIGPTGINHALSWIGPTGINHALSWIRPTGINHALSWIGRDGTNISFPAGVIQRHDPSS